MNAKNESETWQIFSKLTVNVVVKLSDVFK